jgi:proteasome accessory factor B
MMAAQSEQQQQEESVPTESDELARRLVSIALEFSAATRALSTEQIRRAIYGDIARKTFYQLFRRDRERLRSCGFVIEDRGDELWAADPRSFSDDCDADPYDLQALDLLCLQLAQDDSFPYRGELKHALAKIDHDFSSSEAFCAPGGVRVQDTKTLVLLHARAARHAVQVRYVDAQGASSNRRLALYGEFGLRGHVYFVAADLDDEGCASDPHVFRDDRFRRVKELPQLDVVVPESFDIRQWRRLPFQLGPHSFEAQLALPQELSDDAQRSIAQSGQIKATPEGDRVWRVEASDERALASWAIAEAFVPMSPKSLVDAWKALLEEALA